MFYSQFILAKKGPLGTIWIAAHLERKLRKNQITETNISASVDSILFPEVPIALRLSGHLLLGVVRIYSRKVNYLFHDCSEALVKIKHAFHSTSVDLPPEASTAPFRSITLPDTFDFDELEVYLKRDNDLRAAVSRGIVDHNVSARDLITLREKTDDRADSPFEFAQDEGFPEFGDPYSVLVYNEEELLHEGIRVSTGNVSVTQEKGGPILEEDVLPPLQMDDEMDLGRTNIDEHESTPSGQKIDVGEQDGIPLMQIGLDTRLGYSGVGALQESLIPSSATEQPVILPSNASISIDEHAAPMSLPMPDIRSEVPDVEKLRSAVESKEPEPLFIEFEEDMGLNKDALEVSGHKTSIADYDMEINDAEATPILKETPILTRPSPVTVETFGDFHDNDDLLATILGGRTPALKMMGSPSETPAFTQQKRGRSKRKAVFDDVVILSSILMKKQLANTDELRRKRRKIPLTEFELWKLQGSYNDQKFARPSLPGLCADIRELYTRVIKLPATKPLVKSPLDKETVSMGTRGGPTHDTRILDLDAMETAEDMSTHHVLDTPLIPIVEPSEGVTALHTLVNVQNAQSPDSSPVNNEKVQESIDPVVAAPEPAAAEGDSCGKVVEHSEDSKITKKTGFQEAAHSEGLLPDAASEQAPENLVFLADPQDRVFLASDEEEVLEEADVNHNRKGKPFQDKNGWSLRTKAVSQYLKSTLEKLQSCEGETCHASKLSLDNLLRGRTRKEAARMYFETLVLKSKGYIHVEQDVGFADIMLSATELLRKEVF